MPEPRFFFDTISLGNFAIAGRLDLLADRYGTRLQVTQEVLDEVTDGVVAGYLELRGIEAAVADGEFTASGPLSPGERNDYRELLRFLGPGEASCIACAQKRGGVVVSDDRAARNTCADRGIAVTGTIGILKTSALDGSLSPLQADEILRGHDRCWLLCTHRANKRSLVNPQRRPPPSRVPARESRPSRTDLPGALSRSR